MSKYFKTALVLALICVPCAVFGSWFFFFLTVIIATFSFFEIVKASNLQGLIKILTFFVTIIFGLGIIYYCVYSKNIDSIKTLGSEAFKDPNFLPNSFNDISDIIFF